MLNEKHYRHDYKKNMPNKDDIILWPLMLSRPYGKPVYLREEKISSPEMDKAAFLEDKNINTIEDNVVYIHLPFCDAICAFCICNKLIKNEVEVKKYLEKLKSEMRWYATTTYIKSSRFKAVYFGGGTPTALSTLQLVDLVNFCKEIFNILPGAEITVEGNPSNSNEEKLRQLKKAGVNRLSFGIQTFNNRISRFLEVSHTPTLSCQCIENAHKLGYENIDIDLMYGLPGQSLGDWESDLGKALQMKVKQVSRYLLCLSPTSRLFKKMIAGKVPSLPNQDIISAMSRKMNDIFPKDKRNYKGLPSEKRYNEIAPGIVANLLGLGIGARGCINGFLYQNIRTTAEYIQQIGNQKLPIEAGVKLSPDEEKRLYIIQNFRIGDIDKNIFLERYGQNPEDAYPSIINSLIKRGLLEINDSKVKITETGKTFKVNILGEFLPEGDRKKLEEM